MAEVLSFRLCGGIVLVRAEACGKEGWFAFDTGAMQTTLNRVYFPELEGEALDIYKFDDDVKGSGACSCTVPVFRLGALSREELSVLCMDMSYVENALRTQDAEIEFLGSVGIDVIGEHDVLLDYAKQSIVLDPTDGLDNCDEVTLTMGKLPLLPCSIGGETYSFALDTGASACLIGQDMAERLSLEPSEAPPHICTLPCVLVGERAYEGMQAAVSDITAIREKTDADGVIGYQLLARQRSFLGFRNGVLQLER